MILGETAGVHRVTYVTAAAVVRRAEKVQCQRALTSLALAKLARVRGFRGAARWRRRLLVDDPLLAGVGGCRARGGLRCGARRVHIFGDAARITGAPPVPIALPAKTIPICGPRGLCGLLLRLWVRVCVRLTCFWGGIVERPPCDGRDFFTPDPPRACVGVYLARPRGCCCFVHRRALRLACRGASVPAEQTG